MSSHPRLGLPKGLFPVNNNNNNNNNNTLSNVRETSKISKVFQEGGRWNSQIKLQLPPLINWYTKKTSEREIEAGKVKLVDNKFGLLMDEMAGVFDISKHKLRLQEAHKKQLLIFNKLTEL